MKKIPYYNYVCFLSCFFFYFFVLTHNSAFQNLNNAINHSCDKRFSSHEKCHLLFALADRSPIELLHTVLTWSSSKENNDWQSIAAASSIGFIVATELHQPNRT